MRETETASVSVKTTTKKVIWYFSQALTMLTLKQQVILSLYLDRIMNHGLLGMLACTPMKLEFVQT